MIFAGIAHLAGQQPAHQHLAQRAGAAGDQDALAVERFHESDLQLAYGVGSAASSAAISVQGGQMIPVAVCEPAPPEAAVARLTIVRCDLHVQSERVSQQNQQVVLVDRAARHLVDPVQRRMVGDQVSHESGEIIRAHAGPEMSRETPHGATPLREEPFQQGAELAQLATNDRRAQGECVRYADLAQELGASVEILRVRHVFLGVIAAPAAEHAVGTEMDDPPVPRRGGRRESVGQQGIDRKAGDREAGLIALLDDTDTVDDDLGTQHSQATCEAVQIHDVDALDHQLGDVVADPAVERLRKRPADRADRAGISAAENLEHLVPEHALAAQHHDAAHARATFSRAPARYRARPTDDARPKVRRTARMLVWPNSCTFTKTPVRVRPPKIATDSTFISHTTPTAPTLVRTIPPIVRDNAAFSTQFLCPTRSTTAAPPRQTALGLPEYDSALRAHSRSAE